MPHRDRYVSLEELPDYAHVNILIAAHSLQSGSKNSEVRGIKIKPPYARMLYQDYDLPTKAWIGKNKGKNNPMFLVADLKKIDTEIEEYYPQKIPTLKKIWREQQQTTVSILDKKFGMNLAVPNTREIYLKDGVEIYNTMKKSGDENLHNVWNWFCYFIEYNAPFKDLSPEAAMYILPLAFGIFLPPPDQLTIGKFGMYEKLRFKMAGLEKETFIRDNRRIRSLKNEIHTLQKGSEKRKRSVDFNRKIEIQKRLSELTLKYNENLLKIKDLWVNPEKYPEYFGNGDSHLPPNYGLTQSEFDTYVLWHNFAFRLCLEDQISELSSREGMQKFVKGLLGLFQMELPKVQPEPEIEIVRQKPPKPKVGENPYKWVIDISGKKFSHDKFDRVDKIVGVADLINSLNLSEEEKGSKISALQSLADSYLENELSDKELLQELDGIKKSLL